MHIPTYSQDAKLAISTVTNAAYKGFIYFEDEDGESFYDEIVKKLTPDFRNYRVICLKGKSTVIEKCMNDGFAVKKKSIYVLDKDFDNLLGKMVALENLLYLDRYSVENYLFEDQAVTAIALEERPKLKETLATVLALQQFREDISTQLLELTSLFYTIQKYNLEITSCGDSIYRFTKTKQPWILCASKISTYKEEISNLLILNDHANDENQLSEIFQNSKNVVSDADIPGKHLIGLLKEYLARKLGARGLDMSSFCFRLAKGSSFETLEELKRSIQRLA
jgi:hypothetical protein